MIHVLVEVGKNSNIAMENRILMKRGFTALLFVLFAASLSAQVYINEEADVSRLMDTYYKENAEKPIFRGWRIQITTTNDRSEMESAIRKFDMLYPEIDYKWQHNPPYYQVRIGAYQKRDDLEAFLLELKKEFPSAIPVQDDIRKIELFID